MFIPRMASPPATMKAAAIDRFGPARVLKLHTLPVPAPRPGQVLIALHAAGVGAWDAQVRNGSWRPYGRPRFPLVPGTDGAGFVVAKGAGVRRLRIGERVWAADYASGFYTEYVAVNARHAARVPLRLGMLEAGAGLVTGLTALQGIDDALHVRRGDTVLVFGASGAVGTLAVQFAKRRKARVIATASGPKAARLMRRLGADGVFDARASTAVQRLGALAPGGITAVLALAGGGALERCLDLVQPGGRIAYPHGVEPVPQRRSATRLRAYDAVLAPRELARLDRAVREARLRVPIAAMYPLARAAQAHQRLERGHLAGRLILRIRR
jgi:NADPH:quinone reductase